MKKKYFDIITPEELRKLQEKSNLRRIEHQNIKARLALEVFENSKSISDVSSIFKVKTKQAYNLVNRGKELKNVHPAK